MSIMPRRVLYVGETEICGLGIDRCLFPLDCRIMDGPICPENALEFVRSHETDLVVIWLIASEAAGFALCRNLTEAFPSLPVILFALDPDDLTIADAAYVRARACVDVRQPCRRIQQSVRMILRGASLFTAEQIEASRLDEPLTRREVEVLILAARGFGRDQIAAELRTRPGTVRDQLAEARSKLDVGTTPAAVTRARRRG
jgi:two-component system response regulator DesR